MDRNELLRILTNIYSKSDAAFIGVFAADQLPLPTYISSHTPCAYVVNTDPSGKAGTHWVAIFHPNKTSLEFFDSFGYDPHALGFNFSSFPVINYNVQQVQSNGSKVCGHYCIYFLAFRIHGYSFASIMTRLHSLSHSASDNLVYSFTNSMKTYHQIN